MAEQQEKRPLVIGHRGAAGEAPENTLASFRRALEQGADAVELDVHLSADGELIVCHDPTVDRTTNGTGAIHLLSTEALRQLDAGSWYGEAFAGERLPLLGEVFALLPAELMINVEIKCLYSPQLSARLQQLLEQYNREDSVVVSSFSHKVLHQLKSDMPALRMGLLYVADFVSHPAIAQAAGFEVYSLHPYYDGISQADVTEAAAAGLQVYPYTVNTPQDLKRVIQAGVSGIITDFPGRLRELLDA